MKKIIFIIWCVFSGFYANSQTEKFEYTDEGYEYPAELNNLKNPCITQYQYEILESQNIHNCKLLGMPYKKSTKGQKTTFIWPLRTANGLNDCSYYYIGNYLDHDTTSPGILDWNCGSVTYDGHHGTDICIFPYPFYKMDNNLVEVIAAATGIIINKVDGHYDRNCIKGDSIANYMVIQHSDGSCALYWHMKKNSLTSKQVGDTIYAGEYLGIVGSSGKSTGPHLHFEVLKTTNLNSLNDLYAGSCNKLNDSSWWVAQKPYQEPAIIQTSVHPSQAVFSTCPSAEIPNEDSCFTAGSTGYFYTFYRNEMAGTTTNLQILNPDGSIFTNWTRNNTITHICSYWISTRTLPMNAGIYTFEAIYNGDTCRKKFEINCMITDITTKKMSETKTIVSPNPFSSEAKLKISASELISNATLLIYDLLGHEVKNISEINSNELIIKKDNLKAGVYFYKIINNLNLIAVGKLIIE